MGSDLRRGQWSPRAAVCWLGPSVWKAEVSADSSWVSSEVGAEHSQLPHWTRSALPTEELGRMCCGGASHRVTFAVGICSSPYPALGMIRAGCRGMVQRGGHPVHTELAESSSVEYNLWALLTAVKESCFIRQ